MVNFLNDGTPQTLEGSEESDYFDSYFLVHYELGENDNDTVSGNGGNDVVNLTPGQDRLYGGDGFDTFSTSSPIQVTDATEEDYDPNDSNRGTYDPTRVVIDLAAGTYSVLYTARPATFNPNPTVDLFFRGRLDGFESLVGAGGGDKLLGSNRDEIEFFQPGGGDDVIDGRGGYDWLLYQLPISFTPDRTSGIVVNWAEGIVTDGLGGQDTFRNIERVVGSGFADVFLGDDGDQEMSGAGGNDNFFGGGGFDRVIFGIITGSGGGVTVDLQARTGINELGEDIAFRGIEAIRGTVFADILRGSTVADELNGNFGDDMLVGRGGDDTLIGSSGADIIEGGAGFDTIDFSREFGTFGIRFLMLNNTATDSYGTTDQIIGVENVIGTALGDQIIGDARANTLWGGEALDTLGGGENNDTLYGGAGDDSIGGNEGTDTLYGGAEIDLMSGGTGDDTVYGGVGNDRMFGGEGLDTLFGGDSDDFLRDSDPVSAQFPADDVSDQLNAGVAIPTGNFDTLRGDAGRDTIQGTGFLYGGGDDDIITGTGLLSGGAGNDRLTADVNQSIGRVYLVGGAGNDRLTGVPEDGTLTVIAHYGYATQGIIANLASGTVTAGPDDTDVLVNIGSVRGSLFDDRITGAGTGVQFGTYTTFAGNDTVTSRNAPNLTVFLGEGDDIATLVNGNFANVEGDAGDDRITVTEVDSVLVQGGADNDRILVSAAEGKVDGNAGADRIEFRRMADGENQSQFATVGGTGADTFVFGSSGIELEIRDFRFSASERDIIDLRPLSLGLTKAELLDRFIDLGGSAGITLPNSNESDPGTFLQLNGFRVEELQTGMFLI